MDQAEVDVQKTPLAIAVRGFCMGCADIIPGVSGGTVALIMGIYQQLLEAIRSFSPRNILALIVSCKNADRVAIIKSLRELHLHFLVPLGLGLLAAILIASRILPPLLERYPEEVNGLFFGLILASSVIPFLHMQQRSWRHLAIATAAFGFAFWLTAVAVLQAEVSATNYFIAGALCISAMVLPGLSGAYLLKVAGLYKPVLESLKAASSFDLDGLWLVSCFVAGIALGLPIFVRVLLIFLRRAQSGTMAALTGLMLGALGSVWPYREAKVIGTAPRLPLASDPLVVPLSLMVVGLLTIAIMLYWEAKSAASPK